MRRELQLAAMALAQLLELHHDLAPFDHRPIPADCQPASLILIDLRIFDFPVQANELDLAQCDLSFQFIDLQPEDDLADLVRGRPRERGEATLAQIAR